MKKLLSLILTITMLCYMAITAFAEKIQNYEYILPMEYTMIERCQNCYIAYDKQDKCAIYDLNGKKLSDDYDYIGSFFNEQVAEARKDNQYYIINPYGTVLGKFDKRIINVSEYVLVNLTDSNEDGRPLSYFEGEFGVYTYTGDLVKVLSYEEFKPPKNWEFWITFAGGRMLFTENGKWGAVDSSFNTFIEPIYDKIYPFTDAESRITTAIKDGKYGLIDQDGKTAADFVYDEMYPIYDSNNGKINAYKVMQNLTQKPQFGLLDRYGKTIKQLGELEPQTLYEDYKLIKVSKRNNRDDSDQYEYLYGLIGYDGNIVIPVENTNIWGISEGVVAAQKAEDQNGYYDINGREITDFKYIAVSRFSEGLAFASSFTGGVWTHEVINKNGEALFNPSNWSGGFCGGIAQIEAGKFIDANGNIIIDNPEWTAGPELNRRNYKDDGRFIVSDGENCGVAKYTGFISPWAKETISEAKRLNIIKTDANYNYTAFISREEFCELVFNYIKNFPGSAFSVGIIKPPFTDTDNEHIEVLNALGIIKGKSETEFAPNDSLTREEAAAILCRLINKIYPGWDATAQYFDFADSGQFSDWAMNDIQVICNMGIMQGVGDNRFAPKELYTTEQAIATLVRVYNNFSKSNDISNAENLSYSQIEDLQESVNNGHFPWRLDYKQVIMNFLSDKGEKVENGELVAFAGDGEKCSGSYKIGNSIYTLELFKPVDKSDKGIWVVKSCRLNNFVDEKFTVYSLPWGKQWDELKNEKILSDAVVVRDDENTFAVKLSGAEFLGVKGDMMLIFSLSDDSYPAKGLVKAYFGYDKNDKEIILTNGEKIYGERKSYFLDKNGIENPLNPPAWYSEENLEEDMSQSEREAFSNLLKDRGVEQTRADAIMRGPLVVISPETANENVMTISGQNAAVVYNLRNAAAE